MLIRIDILDDIFYRVPFYRNALFLGMYLIFFSKKEAMKTAKCVSIKRDSKYFLNYELCIKCIRGGEAFQGHFVE